MIWGLQGLGLFAFQFVIGAPSQHEGITETCSIVIEVSSHHDGPMYAILSTIVLPLWWKIFKRFFYFFAILAFEA